MNVSYSYIGYHGPRLVYTPYQLMTLNPAAYAPVIPAAQLWELQNLAYLEAWRASTQLPLTPPLLRQGVSTDSIKAGRIFWLPREVAKDSVYWSSRGDKAHGALSHPVVVLSDVSPAGTVKCLLLTSWKDKGGSVGKWSKSTDPTRKYYLALGYSGAFVDDKYLPTDVEDSKAKVKPLLEYTGPKAMDRRSYVDVASSFEIEPHNLDNFKGDACITPESIEKLREYQRVLLNSQQRLRSDWRSKTITK